MDQLRVMLQQLPDKYAFLDPAAGKQGKEQKKRGLARSAIVVIGREKLGRVFVLEAWARRCSTGELIEEVFRVNLEWKVRQFGVEANAMQSLFADAVDIMAKEKQIRLPLEPIMQNTRIDKNFRIKTALQPLFNDGKLIVGEDQQELRNEMKAFPRGQTVDLVDALASAVMMLPAQPIEVQGLEEGEALAKYLRGQGVGARYIDERMARFYRERGIYKPQRPSSPPRVRGRVRAI